MEYLTKEEIQKMLYAARQQKERDYLFLKTLWLTGARISEIVGVRACDATDGTAHPELGLTPSAINPRDNLLRLACLKRRKYGGEFRWVRVPSGFVQELLAYCHKHGIAETDRIFQFGRDWAYRLVRTYAERAGVRLTPNPAAKKGLEVSPHKFRHANAIHIIQRSKDLLGGLVLVQRRLGHKNLSTTLVYMKYHPSEEERAIVEQL